MLRWSFLTSIGMTIPQAFEVAFQHHQSGRLAEAEAFYRQILAAEPGHIDALHMLGLLAGQVGRPEVAVDLLRQVIALRPDFAGAHSNLGNALRKNGLLEQSVAAYRQAIVLKPDFAEAYNNLGTALYDMGHLEEAIASYHHATALRPNYSEAYSNLGFALKEKGCLDEAIAACRQAIAITANSPEAYSNLGIALYHKGQLDEAIAAYREAIALKPNYPEAHSNLGNALQDEGRADEAIAACRQAIALKPDFPEAHQNLGIASLLRGHFLQGWEEYEWRWQCKDNRASRRDFPQPKWRGETLHGQHVLIHAEQGFGDTLQFVRYVPLVVQRGGRVSVECQPGLEAILASVLGNSQIIPRGQPLPAFDLHCPMMSLPLAFETRLETIPATIPYLHAAAPQTLRWRERLAGRNSAPHEPVPACREALKVGLVWAGDSRPHLPRANLIDRRRSLHLRQLAPLAEVPGVVFVSLQKGVPAQQTQTPPLGMRVWDWTAELHDFTDTAALLECLDLVISVDTAVAHLAGAMGKPVWMLSRFDGCWRWLMNRADTPWYPTMRLFRQPAPGDWNQVIAEVREQLQLLVNRRMETP
jgi:Flp pilus assembly protein TadD